MNDKNFDVIIIGGSYAGLSAAMSLGRSLRNVLVIDSGTPCNRQTPHSHNFLTQDGKTPKEISTLAKEQVQQYNTVKFHNGIAIKATKMGDNRFEIATESGKTFTADKVVLATGIKDLLPDIEGFSACWGISAVHCPYCHGYEFKNKKTAILANVEVVAHLAPLVNNLTNDLTILTNGQEVTFSEDLLEKFHKYNINIITDEIIKMEHQDGSLESIVFKNGKKIPFDAVYSKPAFVQTIDIPVSLGCELTEHGYIKVDNHQKTTVPNVFACGDNASPMRAVANAVAAGNLVGALINKELTEERF